jgi:predicted transcriptional regulator
METRDYSSSGLEAEKQTSLVTILKSLEDNCKTCNPLTPIVCVTECNTWKLKNELRKIHEKMQKPNFFPQLLNTLKNKRRCQILDMISRQRYSISQLQQKLKSLGYSHSQQTIVEEYINPLAEVGLVQETQNPYHATILGCRVNELVKDFHDLEDILPTHSECYEETVLNALLENQKTYEDMRAVIPAKSVARVLSRLQRAALVQTSREKNYIFFFKTKRDSRLSRFSPTERRVYENIPTEGVSAKKLSENTGISLRRTYKYLRKLKGKKLIFTRKKPLSYSLTIKGAKVAAMLKAIHNLAIETQATTTQLLKDEEAGDSPAHEARTLKKKDEETMAVANTMYTRRN